MSQGMLKITVASTFVDRGRGLLGRSSLDPDQGLLIVPCPSIHTLFMRFPIDVVFFDASGLITNLVVSLGAWRFAWGGRGSSCLELSAGGAARHGFRLGQRYASFALDAVAGRRTIDLSAAAGP